MTKKKFSPKEIAAARVQLSTPEKRLAALNRQFAGLDLKDFLRKYTDRSTECAYRIPSETEIEKIFMEMKKDTEEKRHIDCGCCGYDSCREMTVAIANGFSHRLNCVHYIKDRAYEEKDRAVELSNEVQAARDKERRTEEELQAAKKEEPRKQTAFISVTIGDGLSELFKQLGVAKKQKALE